VLFCATAALGGTATDATGADEPTADIVQARLKQLDDAKDIDEALKAKIRKLYQDSQDELSQAKIWKDKATAAEQQIKSVPAELEKARAALASLPDQPSTERPAKMPLAELEQAISKMEAGLNAGRNELARLEAEPKQRATRRIEIPKTISAARDRLADVARQLQTPPPADESAALTAARRVLLQARKQVAEAEIAAGEKEILVHEATAELLSAQRDLAARRVALAGQDIKRWRESLNYRREREADRQVERAQREAGQVHPAVRKLAQDNAELAEMRKDLAQTIAETAHQLEQARQQLAALKDQFKRVQEKAEAVGPTNPIGLLLRKQREALPSVNLYRRNITARQATIRDSQLALLQLQDQRSELADLELQVQAAFENLEPSAAQAARGELEAAVRELLKTKKEYLDALIGDHNSHFDKLVDLDNAERQLIREVESCGRFIDERVLWIGSAPPLGLSDLRHAAAALAWLVRPEGWHEVGRTLMADARHNPVAPLVGLAALVALVRWHGRLRRRLEKIGELAARGCCYRFRPTIESLVLTLLMPVILPGILWYVSWRLSAELDASEWCKAVGRGLASMAKVYFVFGTLQQVCRPKGLGESHFGWNPAGLKMLRAQIRWFLVASLPLTFLIAVMTNQENERWRDSMGRMGLIAGAVVFAVFQQRALRPNGSVSEALLASRRGGWLDRLRYVWYPLVVLYPLVLAVLAGVGYFYTAQHLSRRIFTTIYLVLGLMLLRAVLMRWALVNRRKLTIEHARKRRGAAPGDVPCAGEAGLPPIIAQRDVAAINSQTRRLIDYSLALAGTLAVWFAWVDVLPALRMLHRVELWQTVVNVTETVRAPDGSAALRTVERLSAITLADLGLAALVLATALIAVKNIPGLLEMGLLQHLPLDPSVRYAVGAVSRYVITIVGIVLACNTIGLSWARVQWLVAAVGVGLGFGLQEIFANFISGLIILFERPVRVGDVVTMDGSQGSITGIVSRIRMRATTITNWDRKELIIPNKEFITGRVLNWTLSDQVNRVVINVGIAYGSDTQHASELLLKVAKGHKGVLADPPPTVSLEEFGPSSLNFVLRCFLPNLENRVEATHQLHIAIERELREAGIEIAFPQHDVHVRSVHVGPEVLQAVMGDAGPHRLRVADAEGETPAERRVA
jgi:potassium efflux system protein